MSELVISNSALSTRHVTDAASLSETTIETVNVPSALRTIDGADTVGAPESTSPTSPQTAESAPLSCRHSAAIRAAEDAP